MTINEIIEALKENRVYAGWQEAQYNPRTNAYEDCLFVRILDGNNWCRFFFDDENWDLLLQELFDIAEQEEQP